MTLTPKLAVDHFRALLPISIISVALLGGCATSNLENSGATKLFDLAVQSPPQSVGRRATRNVQLVVYEPVTVRTLDGDRVVVRLANSQVNYLDGARWSDRLPALLQDSLIESLTTPGGLRAVSNGRDKVDPDVSLSSTIQAFEVDLGKPTGKTGHVSLTAKLVDERSGSVLDGRTFEATTPLKANAPSDHVIAIKEAFAMVSKDLVAWIDQVKIKERKDKMPATLSRGTVLPSSVPGTSRISGAGSRDQRL